MKRSAKHLKYFIMFAALAPALQAQSSNDQEFTFRSITKICMNDWWQSQAGVVYLNEPGIFEFIASIPVAIAADRIGKKIYRSELRYTLGGGGISACGNLDGSGTKEIGTGVNA
jgi:hypothetical protein